MLTENELRRLIAVAVDSAMRDIIIPVIERSVTIALVATRELVLKDFCMENDEMKLQNAANSIIKSLAGSLALVTSREPFRISFQNNLKDVLKTQTQLQMENINTVIEIACNDNIELGCALIEKAVIEKALKDVVSD